MATRFCVPPRMRPESEEKLALQRPCGLIMEDAGNVWTSCVETEVTSMSYTAFSNRFGPWPVLVYNKKDVLRCLPGHTKC